MNSESLSTVVAALESGKRPKGGVSDETGTIPSLGGEHLNNDGGFRLDKLKFIEEDFFNGLKKGAIRKNDILIVKDGATTGKVSYVSEDFPFKKAAINEHLFALTVDTFVADSRYVFSFLKSPQGQMEILKDFRGAAIGGISRGFVNLARIPLPPLDDQIRIAHLLGKVEGLIARRKQHLQQLDDLLKSVFLEMFGDPVRNERGWNKKSFSEFSESRLGKMRDKKFITGNHLHKYVGNSNVQWFRFVLDNLEKMDFDEKERQVFKLSCGDLLICEGGEIGRCAIWRNNLDECYFQKAIHRVKLIPKIAMPEYVQFVMLFYSLFNGFKNVTSKATIAHLTGEKLKETVIPLPPVDLQNQFAAIVEKVESIKSRYQKSLTELENLYGALSQKAFKGELDLSRVPLPVEVTTEDTESREVEDHEIHERHGTQTGVAV